MESSRVGGGKVKAIEILRGMSEFDGENVDFHVPVQCKKGNSKS